MEEGKSHLKTWLVQMMTGDWESSILSLTCRTVWTHLGTIGGQQTSQHCYSRVRYSQPAAVLLLESEKKDAGSVVLRLGDWNY